MPDTTEPKRGDVVRVRLDPTEGSGQGGERPALVLSPGLINKHSPVVVVASITSRKTERVYPFEALLEAGEAGLTPRSKVLLMQTRSIDKRRIIGFYGQADADAMRRVEAALRIATGLAYIEAAHTSMQSGDDVRI